MIKWKLNISTWTATQHRRACMLLVRTPPKIYLHVLKTFPQSLHWVLNFDSPQANNMSKSKIKCTSQHKFSNSEIRCITCFSLAKKIGCFNYKNYFHNNVNEELHFIFPHSKCWSTWVGLSLPPGSTCFTVFLFVLKAWWKSLIQVTRQPCRWENIMFGLLHFQIHTVA